jgi:hypothetical protein
MLLALTTAVRFSNDIGCFGVLTHRIDDEVRAFHARFGFETVPFDPKRSMIVRIADLQRNGFQSAPAEGPPRCQPSPDFAKTASASSEPARISTKRTLSTTPSPPSAGLAHTAAAVSRSIES